MDLGIAQVAARLDASPILCEINHKIEALLPGWRHVPKG
jgi:hypothetical protein